MTSKVSPAIAALSINDVTGLSDLSSDSDDLESDWRDPSKRTSPAERKDASLVETSHPLMNDTSASSADSPRPANLSLNNVTGDRTNIAPATDVVNTSTSIIEDHVHREDGNISNIDVIKKRLSSSSTGIRSPTPSKSPSLRSRNSDITDPEDNLRETSLHLKSSPGSNAASLMVNRHVGEKRRVRSSGSPNSNEDELQGTIGSKVVESRDYNMPLDDLDFFLSSSQHSISEVASKRNSAAASLSGLLSFNHNDSEKSFLEDPDASEQSFFNDHHNKSLNGVRRKQALTRKLETENMELRLKLQQYREMNASEQEITRAKHQLARSERRIDELEQALERKNRTIQELSEQRDSAIEALESKNTQELYNVISELQAAITHLEEENTNTQIKVKNAIDEAHRKMPNVIPEHAGVPELIDSIVRLQDENDKLTSLASAAAPLRAQQAAIKKKLTDAGRPGDPVVSVECLLSDVATAAEDLEITREKLSDEISRLRKELNSLEDRHLREIEELETLNAQLRVKFGNEEVFRKDVERRADELQQLLSDSRSNSYSIIRSFFAELFDVLGPEFQESVELQLEEVIKRARREDLSKIPLLTELMVEHTREIAEASLKVLKQDPNQERRMWELESELNSLRKLFEMKWDKAGADQVLRAQVRDLQKRLKLEIEKRKSDWAEYQHSLQDLRRPA